MDPDAAIEVCHLADADATRSLGRQLAGRLLEERERGAGAAPQLLLLHGELGAGKTCLVQGLAEGLGISEPITSPTFALAQHYSGAVAGVGRPAAAALTEAQGGTKETAGCSIPTALVHLDLYRLEQPAAADELFAQEEEEARALAAVLAVEWPERLSFVPEGAWEVRLEIVGEARRARIRASPHRCGCP